MTTYLNHPTPDVITEFLQQAQTTINRIRQLGWRPPWGLDVGCPGGSIHCHGCDCAIGDRQVQVMMSPVALAPCDPPIPPFPPGPNMSPAELMALLHATFGVLESDLLQRFVHGPREIVVRDLVNDMRQMAIDTHRRLGQMP